MKNDWDKLLAKWRLEKDYENYGCLQWVKNESSRSKDYSIGDDNIYKMIRKEHVKRHERSINSVH